MSPSPSPKLAKGDTDVGAGREVFEPPRPAGMAMRRVLRSKRTWQQTLLRNAALCQWW